MENASSNGSEKLKSFKDEVINIWYLINFFIGMIPVVLPIFWDNEHFKEIFFPSYISYFFTFTVVSIYTFLPNIWKPRKETIHWLSFAYVIVLLCFYMLFSSSVCVSEFIKTNAVLSAIVVFVISTLLLRKLNEEDFSSRAVAKSRLYFERMEQEKKQEASQMREDLEREGY